MPILDVSNKMNGYNILGHKTADHWSLRLHDLQARATAGCSRLQPRLVPAGRAVRRTSGVEGPPSVPALVRIRDAPLRSGPDRRRC